MNLDQLIEAERNAPAEPTPQQRRTVWTSIERSVIGTPMLLPGAGTLSPLAKFGAVLSTTTGKIVLATALVAGGTAGALNVPSPPSSTPSQARQNAAPENGRAPHSTKPNPKPEPKVAAIAPTPTPRAVREASTVPIQRPKNKVAPKPQRKRPQIALLDPMAPPPTAPPEPEAPEVDDSAGDIFLARAERALKKNKPETAIALLRVHRKAFPEGPSAERREAMFVRALCEGGMTRAAKARWEFNRKWPKSKYRAPLRELCTHSQ